LTLQVVLPLFSGSTTFTKKVTTVGSLPWKTVYAGLTAFKLKADWRSFLTPETIVFLYFAWLSEYEQ
jgi:hypothetical protein